jgi:hypothetical protein
VDDRICPAWSSVPLQSRQGKLGKLTKITTQVFHVMATTSPLKVTSPPGSGPSAAGGAPTLLPDWPVCFSASDEISASVETVDALATAVSVAVMTGRFRQMNCGWHADKGV